MTFYYVSYKNHTKKIESLSEKLIRESFNVPKNIKVFLQEYVTDINLYVDLEWLELENTAASSKLRLCEEEITHPPKKCQVINIGNGEVGPSGVVQIQVKSSSNCEAGPSESISLDDTDDDLTKITCISEISNTNGQKLERQNAYTYFDEPDISNIENTCSKTIPIIHYESKQDIKPAVYKLPTYNLRSNLGKALLKKTHLSKANKAEFLEKIYESFSSRGIFYLSNFYPAIVTAILNEYPYLSYVLSTQAAKAMQEIKRLFGLDVTAVYLKVIDSFAAKLNLEVISSKLKSKMFMDNIISVGNVVHEKEVNNFKVIGNITMILSENPTCAIGSELNTNGTPQLYVSSDGAVTLMVNGIPFIKNLSSRNATVLWVSAFLI